MKFLKTIVILFLLWLPFTGFTQANATLDEWISRNTLHSDFDSLLVSPKFDVLADQFKTRKIIALGEPTHGSKQAQLLRLKLFKFLVEHNGFQTIALEAIDNSGVVNDYLLYGKGTPAGAVKSMGMWMLDTEETLALVNWMRSYNLKHEEKLRFYGTDITYKFDFKAVRDSLVQVPQINMPLLDSVKNINDNLLGKKDNPSKEQMKPFKKLLVRLEENIADNKSAIESKVSKAYYQFISYTFVTYNQAIDLYLLGKQTPKAYRDSCMAVNVGLVSSLFSKDGKLLYGAHNGHIEYGVQQKNKTAGCFLSTAFNDQFYNIGLVFGRYTFRSLIWSAREKKYIMKVSTLESPNKKSISELLSGINANTFYSDIKNLPKDEISESLFARVRPLFYVGWLFSPGYEDRFYEKKSLNSLYDGLFFIKDSSETTFTKEVKAN